jgi:iron(III) transport system ATP-binding protein
VVKNQGVIEQIGTPADIYRRPATAFVADFVGKMSFFRGKLVGPRRVMTGGVELACADDQGIAPGSEVSLGLRPEEVRVRGIGPGDVNAIEVEVGSLEFLGAYSRARLIPAGNGTTIVADFSANLLRDLEIEEGQKITVVLPPEALRIFPLEAAKSIEAAAA